MIFQRFEEVFSDVTSALGELLETPLRPRTPAARSAIGQSLASIVRFHASGDYDHRDWNLLRLGFLEHQLRFVADKRPDLMSQIRARLLSVDPEHYMGARFEVLVAAQLAYHDLPFSCPEPPDFLVLPESDRIPLECTSVTYHGADLSKLRVKIRKALNKKARESRVYIDSLGGTSRLSVFIDITNLYHGSDMRGRIFEPREIERYVARRLDELGLGAAVLWVLVLDRTNDSLNAGYLRADGSALDSEIKSFLDQHFPINLARSYEHYLFPPIT